MKAPKIIPEPNSLELLDAYFQLDRETQVYFDHRLSATGHYFLSLLEQELGLSLKVSDTKLENGINFTVNKALKDEAYHLSVGNKTLQITAKDEKGIFYGIQTLRQLVAPSKQKKERYLLQGLLVQDFPRFSYRGMHLDVGRHFYPKDFIKKYLDLMALLKMNTFHWHLTEDQGWRIEIKKYPKLTSHAAYRTATLLGHYNDQPHQFDGKPYGGFYSQDDIKELVAYATERQITIIPEIEMPGHSQAAISAYPILGCTGKALPVATKWGVFDEVYCPTEATFKFLEDVIDEVVALFPGKYIHIGGDEAPKTRWKNCEQCQALITALNLKDEQGLQSYFISRMERYINSKGKQIIGWDEILEGGLAPNATVMSWRGMDGAVSAAKEKHEVIMTPTSHCYFDYYQSENEDEPLAIGGYLPLAKVYAFNPIPEALSPEEHQYVIGAQGNVWTEYMPTARQVEYMAFPRAVALSEVLWTNEEHKDYQLFLSKLEHFNKRLDLLAVHYANHLYDVTGDVMLAQEGVRYTLRNTIDAKEIRYTLDGSEPTQHSKRFMRPIEVNRSLHIKAATFSDKERLGKVYEQQLDFHKAVGKSIKINAAPHQAYNAGGSGANAIINGIKGSDLRYGDREWLGFWGNDLEIQIDLGSSMHLNSINLRFFDANGQWIYAPKAIQVFESSSPNKKHAVNDLVMKSHKNIKHVRVVMNKKSRYITIVIPKYGIIPKGLQGAGNEAWTFIDEIIIN